MNNVIRGLYGITVDNDPQIITHVRLALTGGANVIQFRNKTVVQDASSVAKKLADLCSQYNATFIVNDDLELACSVNAAGIHLGKNDLDIKAARAKIGNKIIGVSCYNKLELAVEAEQQGADYVAFGCFFPSKTKPKAIAANIALLKAARKKLTLPIVAIGGITTQNAALLIQSGADSIAVINGLFKSPDIKNTAQEFSTLFTNNKGLT